jgi:PAS domain S-box-containing protein
MITFFANFGARMTNLFSLLDSSSFMPHGHCYHWLPSLLALQVSADAVIAAAYFSIPVALVYFVRRRENLAYKPVFWLFAAFIMLCGMTHLSSIWTIWYPDYWQDGILKGATALVSLATGLMLWPLMPAMLAIPSSAQLKRANDSLREEVALRTRTEEQLRDANTALSQQADILQTINNQLRDEVRERQSAERRAIENEIRLRAVNDAAPIGIIYTDAEGSCRYTNKAYQTITGLGFTEMLGEGWRKALYPDDAASVATAWQNAASSESAFDLEYRMLSALGDVRWVSTKTTPVHDDGRTLGHVGIVEDVTEKREARECLEAALHEKEILLKEIHHRVKNNLQVVHSLLDLQAMRCSDPAVVAMLHDNQARVRSMALVHQILYQSKNFAAISFDEYLEALTRELAAGFDAPNVQVSLDVAPVMFDLETAMPCGLWISELVTNSFKHAFPQGRSGVIAIRMAQDGDHIAISVTDDGIGLPPDAGDGDSLGQLLVRLLAAQIGGEMQVDIENGTRFTLVFASPAAARPTISL